MASPPAPPPPSEDEPVEVARPRERPPQATERERFGVVELERHRKEDGRALILYTCPTAHGATTRGGMTLTAGENHPGKADPGENHPGEGHPGKSRPS